MVISGADCATFWTFHGMEMIITLATNSHACSHKIIRTFLNQSRLTDRLVLAIMRVLWSVAINCGPSFRTGTASGRTTSVPYLYEYILVILADSVGVAISFYFSLQHNRFIKACCFADSSTSKKPELVTCAKCRAEPLSCCRWAFTGLTLLDGLGSAYGSSAGLPLGITILFLSSRYLFCAFKLWDFAHPSSHYSSARLPAMFRLATVWGLKANRLRPRQSQQGAVKRGSGGATESPTRIGLHGDVPPPQPPLLEPQGGGEGLRRRCGWRHS